MCDDLGSTRLPTAYPSPSIRECDDYLPFGESLPCGGSTVKFTGLQRDSESNLDHTQFRQYSSSLGRCPSATLTMSPQSGSPTSRGLARWGGDPAGLAAVDPTNPQSWNRYSYVANSPTSFTDPWGLTDCPAAQTCGIYTTDAGFGGDAWDGGGAPGLGGGNFGGPVTFSTYLPGFTIETDVTDTDTAVDGYFGAGEFLTSVLQPPAIGGSIDWGWWRTGGKTFIDGIVHGVRKPGESFGSCVLRNADETTFGGHQALVSGVVATASAAAIDAARFQVLPGEPPVSGALNLALYAGRFVFLASGGFVSGKTVIAPIAIGIRAAAKAAPYLLAAETGLLVGSGINCR